MHIHKAKQVKIKELEAPEELRDTILENFDPEKIEVESDK